MVADRDMIMRRQLRFRAWHRGTREMDLILGRFADACIDQFDGDTLVAFAELLEQSDPDLYEWITGKQPLPADVNHGLLTQLIRFNHMNNGKE